MTKVTTSSDFSSIEGDPSLKMYYCPFCNKVLFRGKVNRLSMVCHNCNQLVVIDADSPEKDPRKSPDS